MRFSFLLTLLIVFILTGCATVRDKDAYSKGKFKQAITYYTELAEAGDATAQFRVGLMNLKGQGISENTEDAVSWFSKSADQGNVRAMYNMGVAFEKGIGVEQDNLQAYQWYLKAADRGYVPAQFNTGFYLANDMVLPRQDIIGYKWLLLAKSRVIQGSENYDVIIQESDRLMAKLSERMTPMQVIRAELMAKTWRKSKGTEDHVFESEE